MHMHMRMYVVNVDVNVNVQCTMYNVYVCMSCSWHVCCLSVGVVFNGEVKHAGRAVTSGVRHLLVASFSISKGGRHGERV